VPGETPIDPSGLRQRGSITNRRELAKAEALNLSKAFVRYLGSRPNPRSAPFDHGWFLKLHEEMFGDVWTWAGVVRKHDLNIGVPHLQIVPRLEELVRRLHNSWSEYGHDVETQAAWLHHEAAQVHPFENGNGRWARLLANIWLKRHGLPIVAWPDELPGATSTVRDEYLAAMKAADHGDYAALIELHRRLAVIG
jgi:fido (protein-threonine AMPylation protein)